jgi:serralysin
VPLGLVNLATKSSETPGFEPYSGPLTYLSGQFIFLGSDGISLSAAAPNVFLRSGSGDDALQVAAGQTVVDAGTGSNFLAGGVGADTFFLDARDPGAPIWSSILNLTAGDGVTIWGVSEVTHTLVWSENKGAVGFEGLTLAASGAGRKDVLLTLTGLSEADRTGPGARFTLTSGFEPVSKSDYLYLFALS